jgi:hypothetical protein
MGVPPRAAVAALVVLTGLAALVAAQGPERLPERETTCWPCHVAWPTPLRSMYDIIPPEEAGGEVGKSFDYTIEVRNPWLHDIIFIEPALDLAGAPGLSFDDGRIPVDIEKTGVIKVDPTRGNQPQRGFVVIDVPLGATDMTLELIPLEPLYQYDLRMVLYPGRQTPEGEPATPPIDNASAGQPETWTTAPGAGFPEFGFGNWTIVAEMVPVKTAGLVVNPPVGDIDFQVKAHVEFNANDATVQYLSRRVDVGPDQRTLVTWKLRAMSAPQGNLTAQITVNATVYFKHLASSGADDYANVTKSITLQVIERDGQVVLVPDGVIIHPPGKPPGVTMTTISEAVGYASAFLLVASVYSGGMFGRASRRQLNHIFGTAKRRVAFHNFLSYGLTLAAIVHTIIFVVDVWEPQYYWTRGLIWGGLAILSMLALGVTGALQVPMIRRWNYGVWRWSHLATTIAALAFTLVHMFLDGAHFSSIQEFTGWQDPLDPRDVFKQ